MYAITSDFSSENTLFYFVEEKEIVAVFELQDAIKPHAKEIIANIAKRASMWLCSRATMQKAHSESRMKRDRELPL